jgi:nucleoside-diphosphate-sugar epimerase
LPRALILGGTGLVGRAAARRLVDAGWDVEVTGRDPGRLRAGGGTFVAADRHDGAALAAALGEGADLLLDCIAYTAADARLLLPLLPHVTSTVLVSSKAVYVDAAGNHSNSDVAPAFGGPIRETQATTASGDMDHRSREGYGPERAS